MGRESHVFSCFGVIRGDEKSLNVRERVDIREVEWGLGLLGCERDLCEEGGVERGEELAFVSVRLGVVFTCCERVLWGSCWIRSPDGKRVVKFVGVTGEHERNRSYARLPDNESDETDPLNM